MCQFIMFCVGEGYHSLPAILPSGHITRTPDIMVEVSQLRVSFLTSEKDIAENGRLRIQTDIRSWKKEYLIWLYTGYTAYWDIVQPSYQHGKVGKLLYNIYIQKK